MIERTFEDVRKEHIHQAAQRSFLHGLAGTSGTTWPDLLRSRRVLMISEAGAGKTHECAAQQKRMWAAGEPAFAVELSRLSDRDLRSLFEPDEEVRLDAWLSSQSDIATFFLDSVDELQLSLGSFELALKSLKSEIGRKLAHARIVVTSRPVPFDQQIMRDVLPIPPLPRSVPAEDAFASRAMGEHSTSRLAEQNDVAAPDWRTVALMPLSEPQIVEFARLQGVDNPGALLEALKRRNGQDFARRPQDLIELCADWIAHERVRTHREQVSTNVRVKLLPADDRSEPAELSVDKAIEGASRLALAAQVTRRTAIRHSAASDDISDEAALDPARILTDWTLSERKALLQRPLFGFASYGRVTFHHRSVAEYLAAQRLLALRDRGLPARGLNRLLFARTHDKTIARPSMRPIAAWLAAREAAVFETLRDHEPTVLRKRSADPTFPWMSRLKLDTRLVDRRVCGCRMVIRRVLAARASALAGCYGGERWKSGSGLCRRVSRRHWRCARWRGGTGFRPASCRGDAAGRGATI